MKDEQTNKEQSMVLVQQSDVLNLDLTRDYKNGIEILMNLVKSKKLKDDINTPEAAAVYYIKSKELGVPFINALDHMFTTGGKTSLDVHLMRALVLKAGTIHWEEMYNNVPLYKYIDSTGNIIATGNDESCLPYGFAMVTGNTTEELKADVTRIRSINHEPVFKKADKIDVYTLNNSTFSMFNYATRYKFTRIMRMVDGSIKTLVEYGEFSIREAINAGLHLKKDGTVNVDSPWLIYHRNMLESRSWTFGARKIADDILLGALERTEMLDIQKSSYTLVNDTVVTPNSPIEDGIAEEVSNTNN